MRVLAFGIHPDDVELGCGGTVAVCTRRGDEVTIVDLTRGESSSNGTPAERAVESESAAAALGVASRRTLALPDGQVCAASSEHRRAAVAAIREHRPHVVLAPNPDDPHPDHAEGGVLIRYSLYLAGIAGYDAGGAEAWRPSAVLVYSGRNEVRPDIVVDTSAEFETKMKAIRAHRSQFDLDPGSQSTPLNAPTFLSAIEARDRGLGERIGVRCGEAFQLTAPLALGGLGVFAEGI